MQTRTWRAWLGRARRVLSAWVDRLRAGIVAGGRHQFDDAALEREAETLGCEPAALAALVRTLTRGRAFDSHGRVLARYDGHAFNQLTGGRHAGDSSVAWPDGSPTRSGPMADDIAYDQFSRAAQLDREAALNATHWGVGGIIGLDHELAGYESAGAMVGAFQSAEEQIAAFARYLKATSADALLRAGDVDGLARRFDGPRHGTSGWAARYRRNYRRAAGGAPWVTLQLGDSGAPVRRLQELLIHGGWRLQAHGYFDTETQHAVRTLQSQAGLVEDGMVGARTWTTLNAERGGVLVHRDAIAAQVEWLGKALAALVLGGALTSAGLNEVGGAMSGLVWTALGLVPPAVFYVYFASTFAVLAWALWRQRA